MSVGKRARRAVLGGTRFEESIGQLQRAYGLTALDRTRDAVKGGRLLRRGSNTAPARTGVELRYTAER